MTASEPMPLEEFADCLLQHPNGCDDCLGHKDCEWETFFTTNLAKVKLWFSDLK